MRLMEMLGVLGDKLGILQTEQAAPAAPANRIRTKQITLAELTTEIHSEEVKALAELPAEFSVAFERVFESAGIAKPPHGWDTEKLKDLLKTEPFKAQERAEIQKKLQDLMTAEKASAEEIVKEAMARDKAIDAFESFVKTKMETRLAVRERKIAELETKIQEQQKEVQREKELSKAEAEHWKEWRKRKRAYEKELAWVTSFLIDRQVVTISEDTDDME
jgi:valyl-tRNA synthetase